MNCTNVIKINNKSIPHQCRSVLKESINVMQAAIFDARVKIHILLNTYNHNNFHQTHGSVNDAHP